MYLFFFFFQQDITHSCILYRYLTKCTFWATWKERRTSKRSEMRTIIASHRETSSNVSISPKYETSRSLSSIITTQTAARPRKRSRKRWSADVGRSSNAWPRADKSGRTSARMKVIRVYPSNRPTKSSFGVIWKSWIDCITIIPNPRGRLLHLLPWNDSWVKLFEPSPNL